MATTAHLIDALEGGSVRHQRVLQAILHDIEGGAQSFAEIDFARLCRRGGLPPPVRQSVRHDADGRRRHVDARWKDLLAEVDGAVHLAMASYDDDCFRQNERTLVAERVLRFTSLAVRTEPDRVLAQLRRALNGR